MTGNRVETPQERRNILCVSENCGFSLQLTLRDFSMHGTHEKDIKYFDRNPAFNNSAVMEGDIQMEFKQRMWVRGIDLFGIDVDSRQDLVNNTIIILIAVFPCILISTELFLPINALFIKT